MQNRIFTKTSTKLATISMHFANSIETHACRTVAVLFAESRQEAVTLKSFAVF